MTESTMAGSRGAEDFTRLVPGSAESPRLTGVSSCNSTGSSQGCEESSRRSDGLCWRSAAPSRRVNRSTESCAGSAPLVPESPRSFAAPSRSSAGQDPGNEFVRAVGTAAVRPPYHRPPYYRPPQYRPPHHRPPLYRPPEYLSSSCSVRCEQARKFERSVAAKIRRPSSWCMVSIWGAHMTLQKHKGRDEPGLRVRQNGTAETSQVKTVYARRTYKVNAIGSQRSPPGRCGVREDV